VGHGNSPEAQKFGVVHMIKILATITGAAVLAGAVVLLAGMTPLTPTATATAATPTTTAAVQTAGKSDRLDIRDFGPGCTERGWPYYEAACLRTSDNTEVKRVRIVTTDRIPGDVRFATSR
jgi:hypothetical protein